MNKRSKQERRMKRIVNILLLLTIAVIAHGQVSVKQELDSVAILIGEQTDMKVKVLLPKGKQIVWPELKERQFLVPGVEIISVTAADSVPADDNMVEVTRRVKLTSFDESLYAIPGMAVKVDGKEYQGNTLALKVITMDVDTLHPNQFFPPKDVQKNPFLWAEWRTPFLLSLLFVALLFLAVWFFLRLKANKPIIASIRIIKKILPHQRAMKAIDQIKAEHMTASEDQKEYYTRLTDTLRQYIRERFGFNAMEMTTPEIIFHLQESGDQTMIGELKELFETADLVKFAKYSTLVGENDMNLVNAINFIDLTKLEGQPTEERIVPKLTEGEERTRKTRIVIKVLIWTIAVIEAVLFSYILYSIFQLM